MYWTKLMFSFHGRISRVQFSVGLAFLASLILVSQGLLGLVSILWGVFSIYTVCVLNILLSIYPLLALMTKRLSDAHLSKTLLWVNLLPAMGSILLICLLFVCETVVFIEKEPIKKEHMLLKKLLFSR
ncbi:MAG: DUF805 domain-containing protein [Plesiomonas sp.]|uniref:DUF805 domain-containing protein n=1 Tax=Plesiomonas sp. TaxID=2486279 RepID=UPI003F34E516